MDKNNKNTEKKDVLTENKTFIKKSDIVKVIMETLNDLLSERSNPKSEPKKKTTIQLEGRVWKSRLQNVYSSLEELEHYDEMFGIVSRLGFDSAEDAWNANPLIQGSVNPKDFKVVGKK